MNAPAVQHFGDVQRRVAGGEEPSERVPVVAALGPRVGVGTELHCQLAIDDAKMRRVARVREEDGIECGLEIGMSEVAAFQFVFVGVGQGGIAGLPQRVRHDAEAVGRQQIVLIHRHDVSMRRTLETEAHAADDPEVALRREGP